MSIGNPGYRTAPSPFANSIRQPTSTFDPSQFGLGGLLERLKATQRQEMTQGPENAAQPAQLRPANPFEGNEQYQALMEYQKSMAPSQEQQDRLQELSTAFENTGGYKDYRINQMEQQMQRMQQMRQPRMGISADATAATAVWWIWHGSADGWIRWLRRYAKSVSTAADGII